MQKALLGKTLLIALVFVLLLVPLLMIRGLVAERGQRQQAVVEDLARSSYGRQALAGPILTVPYVEEYDELAPDGRKAERRRIERALRLFAASESVDGVATVETKSRGLLKARVFEWRGTLTGEFVIDATPAYARTRPDSRITWGRPFLGLYLSDPRGLTGAPALEWNGQPLALERGSGLAGAVSGLHADLPDWSPGTPRRFAYSMTLGVHGTESLSFVPLAGDARLHVRSDWPHPSFGGQFLPRPDAARPSGAGFDAQWIVSGLASNGQQQMSNWLEGAARCAEIGCIDHAEVRFIEPVDIYALSDRAVKYGFLFIAFTFGSFFFYELLKSLRIHPAQYLLVGLALATFFLLLLSLSEHVPFWLAYVVAAFACIALITSYLCSVLRGVRRGLSFGLLLTVLYGALYGLLASEDNALLLGSGLVFVLIAAAMLATRKLDWYAVAPRAAP